MSDTAPLLLNITYGGQIPDDSLVSANQCSIPDPVQGTANQCVLPELGQGSPNQCLAPDASNQGVTPSYQGDSAIAGTPETALDSVPEKDPNDVALRDGATQSDQASTATPEKSPDSGTVDYAEVALKFGEGVGEGALAAVALAGLAAVSPVLTTVAVVGGLAATGYGIYETFAGNDLSAQQRWDLGAQIAGGFVGGYTTGGFLTADMFGGTSVVGTPSDVTGAGLTTSVDSVTVSRWGGQGLTPDQWVMPGDPTLNNYLLSGKFQPWIPGLPDQFQNEPATFGAGQAFNVPSNSLQTPSGSILDGWIKSIFGQMIYSPPGPDNP